MPMKPPPDRPDAERPTGEGSTVESFVLDPAAIEASLEALKQRLVSWAKKGRHTKVRLKFRGKPILPDLPLVAVAAVEGATLYWAGLLRALVVNLAGRSLIEVELINDAEKKISEGQEALLSGDVERALEAFTAAAEMDPERPAVHLHRGIALKLLGDHDAARTALEVARSLAPEAPTAREAERLLATLRAPASPRDAMEVQ